MRPRRNLSVLFVIAIVMTGCAGLLRADGRPSPERVLDRALAAIEHGYYESAAEDLAWVSTYHLDRPAGRLSLLVLAALELDPDKPVHRPERAVDRLETLRAQEENALWLQPVAEGLLSVAVGLRETEARAVAAERAAARAERSARDAAQRARAAEQQAGTAQSGRAEMQRRIGQLERELAVSRQQATAARQEVARMRRVLDG
jgi:hypothetical protein